MKLNFFLVCFVSWASHAQILSADRKTDWTLAGLKEEIPVALTTVYFEEAGGIGDGVFSNTAVLNEILDEHGGEPFEIIFPTGIFYFNSGFSLPSNCRMAGLSADSTVLVFDLAGSSSDLFSISGTIEATEIDVIEACEFGQNTCLVGDSSFFSVGDWVLISDDDSELITSDWALKTTGQLLQINAISGFELSFDSPFRRSYELTNFPLLRKINPKENVLIENLTLKRMDETVGQSNQIAFNYAVNCAVKCIESEKCNFSHIRFQFSNNCEVSGSYFHDAHNYGGGGKGYGVVCQFATGECLIRDNNFNHLRHAMLLQSGANGNVYSYNYSQDPYWTDVALPANSAGDMVLHGNYVYANLFEGNICQNIVIDDSHGQNGPYNTFFRNRAELYGIFMNSSPATDRQNFIGNEIPNEGFLLGLYAFAGTDHFFYGNNHRGEVKPEGTDDLEEPSLYVSETPFYYDIYSNWPPIGYPAAINSFNNEAYVNFYSGWTVQCENTYADLSIEEKLEEAVVIYPNPSFGPLTISSKSGAMLGTIEVYSMEGKLIYTTHCYSSTVSIDHLSTGMYILHALDSSLRIGVIRE